MKKYLWIDAYVWMIATCLIIIMIILPVYQTGKSEAKDETKKNSVQGEVPEKFNHDTTSFPLLGGHRRLQCAQCHLGGRYKTLPTACEECHNGQITYGKPNNHVMISQNCDICHTASAWSPATFRHDLSMVTGQCTTCHNGQKATGKPQNHIATTQQCDTCHRVTAWTPSMVTNHDNPRLIGAHSTLDCKVCHTQSFASAFYRDGTQFGFCANCHTRDYTFPGPGAHKNNPITKTPYASMQDSLSANALCSNCHKHADYRQF